MPLLFEDTSYLWKPDIILHALTGVVILIMGLSTVYRERGTRIGRLYLYYTLSLAFWVISLALTLAANDIIVAEIWARLGNAAIVFIPAVFLHISVLILNLSWLNRRMITITWMVAALFSAAAIVSDDFIYQMHRFDWGDYGQYGPLGIAFLVFFIIVIGFTIYQYPPACRNARSGSAFKNRAIMLFIAFCFGIFGTIDFVPAFAIDLHPNGYIFIFTMFAISTYVTWRYRLIDMTAEYAADNLLNIIKSPLIVLDQEGEIRLTNEAANAFLERVDRKELVDELLPLIERHYRPEQQEQPTNNLEDIEFEFNLLNKKHVYQLSVSPLLSAQETLLAYVCLLQDITDRVHTQMLLQKARDELDSRVKVRTDELNKEVSQHKQTAEALLTAKNYAEVASMAKTEFLSRISHELRTPLNAMLGFTQLMKMDKDEIAIPEHRLYVEQMEKSGEHLLELIEDILDLSQLEMGKLSTQIGEVKLYPIIEEAVRLCQTLADTHHVSIDNQVSESDTTVLKADSTRLKQIIINLITNAIKYNRPDGNVTIKCEKDGNKARIKVTDTGVGIAESKRKHVFEPFERIGDWRHHTEGAGIGLALSRKLATEMEGSVEFESEEGVGTTFWIEIPIA